MTIQSLRSSKTEEVIKRTNLKAKGERKAEGYFDTRGLFN